MCFMVVGYLATVATYLEVLVDYFEARYAGYIRLEENGGLADDELMKLREKEVVLAEASGVCGVCLSEIEANEVVLPMPMCSHAFHSECVLKWLSAKPVCPNCKADVRP
mmetsp:Transcript_7935/g.15431  ORF Transcript_7935/g.15431 Transcript_7935/m.15431 type:complete len:109 (-) Transcript_7935:1894-2220(-)